MDVFILWEQVLDYVKNKDPQYYNMFSEQIFPVSFQGNILTLTVSKPYLSGWIRNVYGLQLKHLLQDLSGVQNPEIVIETLPAQTDMPAVPSVSASEHPNIVLETTETPAAVSPLDLTALQPKSVNEITLPNIADVLPTRKASVTETAKTEESEIVKYNDQTFDTFISAQCNLFAYQASQEVARSVVNHDYSMNLNPLFIYGPSGLGKTHLLHAIRNYIHEHAPDIKSLFITSEGFTNELISAITKSTQESFRQKYRTVDVLLLDDVQFFSNKDTSAIEIFNTFNQLFENKKHIIMTSDRVPEDLKGFEDRLKSRFSNGFVAEISKPDYEICCAILKNKSERDSLSMSEDAIDYIASRINKNIRVLEGAYNTVKMHCKVNGLPITGETVKEALANNPYIKSSHELTVDRIIDTVCDYYSVSKTKVMGAGRPKKIVIPRQVAMYLCRNELQESYPALKDIFHKKDHTSIMYACEKVQKAIDSDPNFRSTIQHIKELLNK